MIMIKGIGKDVTLVFDTLFEKKNGSRDVFMKTYNYKD